jgi:DNA-binding NtrC family response regulator
MEKMTAPVTARVASPASIPSTPPTSTGAAPPPSSERAHPPTEYKTDTYPHLGATGLKGELEAIERQRIIDALERCVWNQTKAARLLGVSRGVLIARLDQYGIARPRKVGRGP